MILIKSSKSFGRITPHKEDNLCKKCQVKLENKLKLPNNKLWKECSNKSSIKKLLWAKLKSKNDNLSIYNFTKIKNLNENYEVTVNIFFWTFPLLKKAFISIFLTNKYFYSIFYNVFFELITFIFVIIL